MGIFDLGVRASVGRHVALYLGKEDPVGVDETIRAGFGFFSLVGVLILLAGILLGWLFPFLFKGVSQQHYAMVRILLPLMAINVWLSAIAAIYSSVLAAHDRFDITQGVDVTVLLVRTLGTIWALEMGWGLWGLVYAVILGNLCAVIGNRIFAGAIYNALKTFPFLYTRKRLQELFGYGIPAFVTSSAVKIVGQSDLILVGILLTVSDVREYSIGAMLIYYFSRNLSIISRTLFPAIQRSAAQNKLGEVRHLLNRQLQISFAVGLLGFTGFFFYSKPFIHLWMFQDGFGSESVATSAGIMMILAISGVPLIYMRPISSTLAAVGHVRFTAQLALSEALANIVLSLMFVLVFDLGVYGIALGTLAARIIPALGSPWFLYKHLRGLKQFILRLLVPGLISTLIFAVACGLSLKFFYPNSWTTFTTQVICLSLIWAFLIYLSFFRRKV
jgi:O-antigen/teichoic acid export membrane protein